MLGWSRGYLDDSGGMVQRDASRDVWMTSVGARYSMSRLYAMSDLWVGMAECRTGYTG